MVYFNSNSVSNIKILVCVIIVFLISLGMIFFIVEKYSPLNDTEIMEKKFFSQNFDSQKKIIILGSSHVGRYNTTFINDYVLSHKQNYKIYNLAIIRDTPNERLKTLDGIISLKPTLVVYGISFRDFENQPSIEGEVFEMPSSPLPDPRSFFSDLFEPFVIDYNVHLKSPKLATLNLIQNWGSNKERNPEGAGLPNTPFYYQITPHTLIIKNDTELEQEYQELYKSFRGIKEPEKNTNVLALEKIIKTLKDNNIKVVIITNPQSKIYLEHVSDSDKKAFVSILDSISQKYDVDIYFLHDKYSNLNIWTDPDHITILKEANPVNEKISTIIIKELES